VAGRVGIERRSRVMGKIGAKIRTDTKVWGRAIPKSQPIPCNIARRSTWRWRMRRDDGECQQPVVGRCDIRQRAPATTAYSGLERFKTSMVAGPRTHQGLSDACATWPPKETEVIGTTGQFRAMIGSREVETVFSNAPDGRLCHTNTLRCR